MKWIIRPILFGFLFLGAIAGCNFIFVELPAQSALSNDSRNASISMHAYWRFGVDADSLVIDVWSVGVASMADIDRCLFQLASSFAGRNFSYVYLSHNGIEQFRLDGHYFHELGVEYSSQNPVYIIRTLPENVQHVGGSPAFSHWEGGLLGVVNKQLEDHAEFHRRWWAE